MKEPTKNEHNWNCPPGIHAGILIEVNEHYVAKSGAPSTRLIFEVQLDQAYRTALYVRRGLTKGKPLWKHLQQGLGVNFFDTVPLSFTLSDLIGQPVRLLVEHKQTDQAKPFIHVKALLPAELKRTASLNLKPSASKTRFLWN